MGGWTTGIGAATDLGGPAGGRLRRRPAQVRREDRYWFHGRQAGRAPGAAPLPRHRRPTVCSAASADRLAERALGPSGARHPRGVRELDRATASFARRPTRASTGERTRGLSAGKSRSSWVEAYVARAFSALHWVGRTDFRRGHVRIDVLLIHRHLHRHLLRPGCLRAADAPHAVQFAAQTFAWFPLAAEDLDTRSNLGHNRRWAPVDVALSRGRRADTRLDGLHDLDNSLACRNQRVHLVANPHFGRGFSGDAVHLDMPTLAKLGGHGARLDEAD